MQLHVGVGNENHGPIKSFFAWIKKMEVKGQHGKNGKNFVVQSPKCSMCTIVHMGLGYLYSGALSLEHMTEYNSHKCVFRMRDHLDPLCVQ